MRDRRRGDAAEYERQRRRVDTADLGPLFAPALPEAPTVAPADHVTSRMAAERVLPIAGSLRLRVLRAIASCEGLTDAELERLPEFASYGFSTVRKRRSELFKARLVAGDGTRLGLTVWKLTPLGVQQLNATPLP